MSTKEKIKQFEISRYESLYKFCGLPFGAKQKQIFDNSFEINYSRPKHSTERKSLAWDVWMYKEQIKKLGGQNGN
ncbi:MAG TPA: hypothetical protein PKN83_26780 [Leptospiraceae bacterium]|nr:hypothetical protein [Leptospiraceae bacterium]HNM92293.1 hypothetical protein [Leptospiraceae bacterium]